MKHQKICDFNVYLDGEGTLEERKNLEQFMLDGNQYFDYLSENAQTQIQNYNTQLAKMSSDEKISVLKDKLTRIAEKKVQQFHRVQKEEQKSKTLKRGFERRAGFINASILLYAILNLGIMIAVLFIIL
ncbi:MAG: hypothetical protein HFH86_05135 [Bacilli bacterium]|jgi:hypothetical protein|nr:hypothetical protein [Bacilli bacterium]